MCPLSFCRRECLDFDLIISALLLSRIQVYVNVAALKVLFVHMLFPSQSISIAKSVKQ